MSNGFYNIPIAVNEPVKDIKKIVQKELKFLMNTKKCITIISTSLCI